MPRHWLGDAVFTAKVFGKRNRVRFLSSFDRQETVPLYFLCQLPRCTAKTVDEAIEALKPETVLLAEQMGRTCSRQGDIFGVPMPGLSLRDLKRAGGEYAKRSNVMKPLRLRDYYGRIYDRLTREYDSVNLWPNHRWHWQPITPPMPYRRQNAAWNHRRAKWAPIFDGLIANAQAEAGKPSDISLIGTAHTATEVVTMPDGTQYARGMFYHDPELMGESRQRDHIRQPLGDRKTWHLVARNTVPVR